MKRKKEPKPTPKKKLVKCRACGILFTPDKNNSGMKYCNDSNCQKEKKNRSYLRQRNIKKRNGDKYLPKKLERTDKVCICCKRNRVPKRKFRGVYLSVLCEECYRLGESDVLQEHRVIVDNS